MRKLFKMAALVTALLVMSVSAWAISYDDHVSVAPNGKGDALIFPVYLAFDDVQTKLQVINTRDDRSVMAKVVFRSAKWSIETLDFFIFLSPTDVWEGYLMWDGAQVVLYTEDDSTLRSVSTAGVPAFASETEPLTRELVVRCEDETIVGYAEVYLAYVFNPVLRDLRVEDDEAKDLVRTDRAGVEKSDLFYAYFSILEDDEEAYSLWERTDPVEAVGDYLVLPSDWEFACTEGGIECTDADVNWLAGNLQLQATLLGWSSALNAVTLRDYRVDYPIYLVDEVRFGHRFDIDATPQWEPMRTTNLLEVEAVLSKNDIGMPYINNAYEGSTFHFMTFPTKLTDINLANCRIRARANEDLPETHGVLSHYGGFVGQTWTPSTGGAHGFWNAVRVRYGADQYDQMENRQRSERPIFSPAVRTPDWIPEEVFHEVPAPPNFEKGWVRYDLVNNRNDGWSNTHPDADIDLVGCGNADGYVWVVGSGCLTTNPAGQALLYTGAPVIPVTVNFGAGGVSAMYGFWTDGLVQGEQNPMVNLLNYHYTRNTEFSTDD